MSVADQVLALREELRKVVQNGKKQGKITPAVLQSFAALHFTTEDGLPFRAFPHQQLWSQLFCLEEAKKILIIAPPGSAKTSWILVYAACYIGFYPKKSIILASVSGLVAERRSLSLRSLVDSEEYQMTFPGIKTITSGEMKWSATAWSVYEGETQPTGKIHPTVSSYGTGGSILGSRASLILGDDLIDHDSTKTEYQRDSVKTWFHNSLMSRRLMPSGRVIIIGNQFHPDDLYAGLSESGEWVECRMPLLHESNSVDVTVKWPDSYTGKLIGEEFFDEEN